MRRSALVLRKDLRVLVRSPLLLGVLIAYPLLVAGLVGLVAGYGSSKPRVALVDEDHLPQVVSVGGHRFRIQDAIDEVGKNVHLVRMDPVEARRALVRAQRRQAELVARIASNGGGLSPPDVAAAAAEVEQASQELVGVVDELQALGVQVKDLDRGLVDFPCVHRGREILLCWELGEEEVAYWHGADEGFAGRRPLPLD